MGTFSNSASSGEPAMLEYLALWGIPQATVFVFRPILEDLAAGHPLKELLAPDDPQSSQPFWMRSNV